MDRSPNLAFFRKLLESHLNEPDAQCKLKQKLESKLWSVENELSGIDTHKMNVEKKQSELLAELLVMINSSAKFKTDEKQNIQQLQDILEEKHCLEEQAKVQSDRVKEVNEQLDNDLQKMHTMMENDIKDLTIEVETKAELVKFYKEYLTEQDEDAAIIDTLQIVMQGEKIGEE